jgi:acetyltransferase-like isoleucine patch superfamily enzyme
MRPFRTHGSGTFERNGFRSIGDNVIFEPGVLVFHPERISLGSNIYIGHQTILKAYFNSDMTIADDVWVGQQCFFHSAGGITIESGVGIGPGVRMLTSSHRTEGRGAILEAPLEFAPIVVERDSDIGVGAILLPGAVVGRGAQIGAGAVVTGRIPDFAIAAGVPAKVVRFREG